MLDLIIKNGKVIDGTGKKKAETHDIGIEKGRITEIGNLRTARARQTVDVGGTYVAPGFIDVQNHSEAYWTIFDYPGQESMLTQGITTITLGQCGASLAPLPTLEAFKSIQKWRSAEGENINWVYFDEFLLALQKRKLGVNTLSFVGHSTMRRGLLRDEVRTVTDRELSTLKNLLSASFKNGAYGLSYGLIYAHEYDSAKHELMELAKIAAKHERVISAHMRNDGSHILEALEEVIGLARTSHARLKISHMKIRGRGNQHLLPQVLEKLESAYKNGIDLRFDVYPYTTSWPILYTLLPKWAYEGGRAELNKRLAQPYLRQKVVSGLRESAHELSAAVIATATSTPHLIGRTIGDIAASQGVSVEEATLNILTSTESEVVVFEKQISPESLEAFIRSPLSLVATNGAGFSLLRPQNRNLVHPRCFGAMPHFLHLILKKKWLTLEQAVHKITGGPAELLGLTGRGIIKKGNIADITVFDKSISGPANPNSPYLPSHGVRYVIVGGELAVEDGVVSAGRYGEVLRA